MAGVEMLPKEYGYVVLILSFYGLFNFWMATQVGKARRKYVSNFLYKSFFSNYYMLVFLVLN